MNIKYYTEPFHYVEVTEVFNEEEYCNIFDEICFHHNKGIFLPPEKTGSAVDDTQKVIKNNSAFGWNHLYKNQNLSYLISITNNKIQNIINNNFSNESCPSWFFKNKSITDISNMVSYYEDSDYYAPHSDSSAVTGLMWFFKKPKSFMGGELEFPDYELRIPCMENYMILFPGNINHSVTPIEMAKKDKNKQMGRFTSTMFLMQNGRPKTVDEVSFDES